MKPARRFPIVGIGSSAGGLEATEILLKSLPPQCGMAFVVIQHLAPDYESHLASILGRATPMKVVPAANRVSVAANQVYVIPPNRSLRIEGGVLRLRARPADLWNPIDEFFSSLALAHGERAVGVVLSGEGSDGSRGIQEIKTAGGLTFAQEPASAGHPSMPNAAIVSGAVDFILPPGAIAKELKRVGSHRFMDGKEARVRSDQAGLNAIFAILRAKKNVDFSGYRPSTVTRRILRRMAVKRISRLEGYVAELKRDPAEAAALLDDLLIQVTSFFRDPDAFKALKSGVYPRMMERRPVRDPLRVWVAGCSTGEEAYSHLINMLEHLGERAIPIQIFATDLSERALDTARLGVYPSKIEHELSPDRLRRFFVKVSGGYQIKKSLRDLCVFAKHDITRDPPFANLDLLSCRNVMIYFDAGTQKRVLPIFHYALRSDGVLMLGNSESVGEFEDSFSTLDKKRRLFQKKNVSPRAAVNFARRMQAPAGTVDRAEREMSRRPEVPSPKADLTQVVERLVLDKFSPPGVVVDKQLDIVLSRGDTSPYLALSSGRPALNLLRMARVDLVVELRELLQDARKEGGPVSRGGLEVKRDGRARALTLQAIPVKAGEPLWLVLFAESPLVSSAKRSQDEGRQFSRLTQELASTREYMRKITQEQDTASEEVKAANEEILASNEELQSTNEELQIAKEELQSANEEMSTVNEELSVRNSELGALSNDLSNLLTSVHIPIVMLGSDLRIRRITPMAEKVLGLVPGHVGRLIVDVPMALSIPRLDALLTEVIDSAVTRDCEVHDREGRWYRVAARPYMTSDKKIDGAVLTFLDITDRRRAMLALREGQEHAEAIVNTVMEPLVVLDAALKITRANRAFCELFETPEEGVKGEPLLSLKRGQWNLPRLKAQLEGLMQRDKHFATFELDTAFRGRGNRTLRVSARLLDREGAREILLALEDTTAGKLAAEAELLRQREHMQREFAADISHELRTPITAIKGYAETLIREGLRDGKHSLDFVRTIDRQAGRLHALIEDLLALSSLETGRRPLHFQSVAARELVLDLAESLAPVARAAGVTVSVRVPRGLRVWADKPRLGRALRNLMENAVKYNRPRGRVEVSAQAYGAELRFTVSDRGMGIPRKELPRVFERFYRSKSARGRDPHGSGLGLAIVKAVAESHGGRAWAESARGRGAAFHITLPARHDHKRPARA